jgi:hypothetical protein
LVFWVFLPATNNQVLLPIEFLRSNPNGAYIFKGAPMKRILFAILFSVLFTACGQSPEEEKAEDQKKVDERLSGKFAFKLWGKTVYLDDKLYELSCNQFMIEFFATKAAPSCVGVVVATEFMPSSGSEAAYNKWTIKSNNGAVNVEAKEDQEKLTIGGVAYSCLQYSGEVYSSDPDKIFVWGTHTLIANSIATKPSEIKEDEVYALAPDDQGICDEWK